MFGANGAYPILNLYGLFWLRLKIRMTITDTRLYIFILFESPQSAVLDLLRIRRGSADFQLADGFHLSRSIVQFTASGRDNFFIFAVPFPSRSRALIRPKLVPLLRLMLGSQLTLVCKSVFGLNND